MEDNQKPPNFPVHDKLASRLVEIDDDDELRMLFSDWENNFKRAISRVEIKRERKQNVKNELYQLVEFFSVIQGVVLGAAAQASTLTCNTAWGPAFLSILASSATIVSVHNKFKEYIHANQILKSEEHDAKSMKTKIDLLKVMGKDINYVMIAKSDKSEKKKHTTTHTDKLYWAVMIMVVIFSIVVVIVIFSILCSKSSPRECAVPRNLFYQGFT